MADIVHAQGETVWGALYEVTTEGLASLDRAEGAGFAYRRREVEIVLDGRTYAAMTYEVIDKESAEIQPRTEYREILRGGAREHGIPLNLGSDSTSGQ